MSSNRFPPRIIGRVVAVGAVAALLALPAIAEPPPRGGPGLRPPPGPPLERVLERLDLGDERLDALYAIVDGARGERRRIRRDLRGAHERMRELLTEDAPDRAEALALVETIGGYELEMHKLDITTLLDVRARLEPAERAELDRAMAPPPRHEGLQPPPAEGQP